MPLLRMMVSMSSTLPSLVLATVQAQYATATPARVGCPTQTKDDGLRGRQRHFGHSAGGGCRAVNHVLGLIRQACSETPHRRSCAVRSRHSCRLTGPACADLAYHAASAQVRMAAASASLSTS